MSETHRRNADRLLGQATRATSPGERGRLISEAIQEHELADKLEREEREAARRGTANDDRTREAPKRQA